MGRNHAVLEGQHDLQQPGDPGGGLRMPKVGLHRANDKRVGWPAPPAIHCLQGVNLNRVAEGGAGAVGLHIGNGVRLEVGHRQCLLDHSLLRQPVRRSQPIAGPILVDRRAANERQNGITGGLSVGEAFEHHHAAALAPHIAIGGGIKGFTATVGGQHIGLREGDAQFGRQEQVDPGGQCQG